MAINSAGAEILIHAASRGAVCGRVLTLGRLHLAVNMDEATKLESVYGFPLTTFITDDPETRYAEPFIERLGAESVESIDVSAYQGCTHCHDLNEPVPESLKGRFDMVVDGGTLEHVFNFPTAIKNCMELLRVGGHFVGITPANGWMGHGLYQFSPELYFRVFSKSNGFALHDIFLRELGFNGALYRVDDPATVNGRVGLQSAKPVELVILARRVADVPPFSTGTPQQSDYEAGWRARNGDAPQPADRSAFRRALKSVLPARFCRYLASRAIERRHAREGSRGSERIETMSERPPQADV